MKSGFYLAFVLCCGLSLSSLASTRYVDLNNSSPVVPFTNWLSAATNIQDAIDVSSAGDLVLVTNGVYKTGSRNIPADLTPCRIVVDKPVTLRSVNGPDSTIIEGFSIPSSFPWSLESVRCAYLTNNAALIGFTLTNGSVRATTYRDLTDAAGGVYCESTSAVISNCVIINCAAYIGGGAQSGILFHSLITNCVGHIGGGGAYTSILDHCEAIWNTCDNAGGGLFYCQATNCNISYNLAYYGGGAFAGIFSQCTVYGNYAASDPVFGGGYGGGLNNVDAYNSIIFNNPAAGGGGDIVFGVFTNCCCPGLAVSSGNITNDPLFIDDFALPGNLHLQSSSPCINAGKNTFATQSTDLDGRPRIVGAKADMGTYEFQGAATNNFLFWMWNHYLLTDISFDSMDSDGDGLNNWQEWRAGTVPNDPASVLKMVSSSRSDPGVNVSWQSVQNVLYYLQRSPGPSAAFSSIKSNIVGQAGITTEQDTTISGLGPFFYRVGVQ
jgi:hypothetical protein